MADILLIPPADLLIDEENPRIAEPNTGQNKALQALARHLGPKLQELAADIVTFGLDPSNLPIVMATPDGRRYVVLEGNRRLAALRALENPDSLGDAISVGILKQIRSLSKQYQANPVESVRCVVMNKEESRHWIELRHTGENAGAGVVPWGHLESERFRARGGAPKPHLQVLDFLQGRGDLSPDVRQAVPGTSLERLIGSPAVREKLGVEVEKGQLKLLGDEGTVASALMHVVNDLASGKTKVGEIYTKEQREDYAKRIPVKVKPSLKPGHGIPVAPMPAASKGKPAMATLPKKRDKLIPRDCILTIPDARLRAIAGELRILSLDEHPNAISVLFRVFVELSMDFFMNAKGISFPGNIPPQNVKLRMKMEAVVKDLVSKKKLTDEQATPVYRACQKDSFLAPSIDLMHSYVHNTYVFPSPTDLRAHWDSLQPFMAAVWAP